MRIRKIAAIWAAKCAMFASVHLFHRQGVTWAGKIALTICPDILKDLASQVRENIFIVCGTNGKTTTNNLLCAALEAEGKKVVCNHTGSNMLQGVAAAFALAADWKGKLDADCACIEIDEASTRRVFPYFKPDYMILTNLFRDQLDRYGEIDITMDLLEKVMQSAPKMRLIVNGDDALCAYLAMDSGNTYTTYGVGEKVTHDEDSHEVREGRFCKCCGAPLHYHYYHYSQLGDYACTNCDFKRPAIDYDATQIHLGDTLGFTVEGRQIMAHYRGFYNIYNILAAYTALRSAGYPAEHFEQMLLGFHPENGRMEEFRIRGTHITLNLAKNPAGFNQNISAVMEDETPKDIIIVINDNAQDGKDVSWLWDVDFDRLGHAGANVITTSGIRGRDMQLRLKYVGIPSRLCENVEDAVRERIKAGSENLYVLVNYTALFPTRMFLKRLEGSVNRKKTAGKKSPVRKALNKKGLRGR